MGTRDHVNNKPLAHLDRWRAGEALRESKLNESIDTLNELRRGVRPPRQIVPVVGGKGEPGEAPVIHRMFSFVEVHDDHLLCYDPVAEADVLVAKRYELRRSTYDGQIIDGIEYIYTSSTQRTLTHLRDFYFERHEIWPAYAAEQHILAVKLAPAEVDVELPPPAEGEDPVRLIWLDTDLQSRDWTRIRTLEPSP